MEDKTQISTEILTRLGALQKETTKNQLMLKCLNPEHADKHASMSVNLEKGLCNCWACGYSGTLTSKYYEITGHSIYKDLGLKRSAFNFSSVTKTETPAETFERLPSTDFSFEGNLTSITKSDAALAWAKKRGFSSSFCDLNNIKFCKHFRTYQTSDPENKEEMSFFKECVVIPIYEKQKLISFEARDVLGKEAWVDYLKSRGYQQIDEKSYRKVLYPKHSSVNTLYQLDFLDMDEPLYIVEGLMDLFSLRTCSEFKNSTCIFHCNPTERQIYYLKKFKKIIYIVDNDVPGLTACKKLMERMPGKVWYLRPPERKNVKDINDILQGKDEHIKSVEDLIKMGWLKKVSDDIAALETAIKDKTKALS